jgi:xylulokinase
MSPSFLIGIDLGTSATKTAIYSLDGKLVAQASAEVPLYYPVPGVVEQEMGDFYRTAAETTRRCLQESGIEPSQVLALACDSQMAGIGSIDEDFNPATRFDSWLDMRCQPQIAYIDSRLGEAVTRLSGCPPTCNHGPKMLWWQHERPLEYTRIASFVTPAGFVAGKVAGLKADQAYMDYTFIHFSACADVSRGAWSDELVTALGLDRAKLPEIVEPWRLVGELTEQAARDFGLAAGTPVAAGCGDTAAGALGAGIVRPGMLFDTAGTASVLAASTAGYAPDVRQRTLLSMHSVIPGLWNPLAYIAGGGLALRWFRDQFFTPLAGQGGLPSDHLYTLLDEAAARIPAGAQGLFFSPHLGGRICPAAPEMRGVWLGFSWGHTRAHFYRAILESVAFEYAFYLMILKELVPGLDLLEARVVGGGAASTLWNSIKASVLGVPYQRLQRSEFATWGSALVAGKAAGIYDDLAEAAARFTQPLGDPILPDPELQRFYQPLADKYIRMLDQIRPVFTAEQL